MNLASKTAAFALAAAFIAAVFVAAPRAPLAQTPTPVPKSTLVPVTEFIPELTKSPPNSFSLGSADRYIQPENLTKLGYVEEEYFISGNANVYDWGSDGKVAVKAGHNAPYTSLRASASAAPRTQPSSAEPWWSKSPTPRAASIGT